MHRGNSQPWYNVGDMSNSQTKEEASAAAYKQDEAFEKEKGRVIKVVQDDKGRRDQETSFFRNETLATYVDVGRAQFIGHRAKPEWKKDYQYNVFDGITRDKVMAIISKSSGMYEAQFFNKNKNLSRIAETIATVLGGFYKDSVDRLNEREINKDIMLTALIEPKVIWYEGWKYQTRTIRDIEERDPLSGEPTRFTPKKKTHYNGPWGQICSVMDIIPGSLRERNLQEQPRFTWIEKMELGTFKRRFPETRYPEAKKVRPHRNLIGTDLSEYIVRGDLKEDEVEVIYHFEKWEDRLTTIANGIMLTKPNSPMPFAHKDYPFVWGGFEPLHPSFIYDMPLTMKLLDMQDMNNEILNLSLDMVWRALQEVILVGNSDGINDDVLYGGGMVEVNDPKNFQKFEFGSSFGFQSAREMREVARRSIESGSLDAPASGQTGTRQITAREALIAREAALEITSLFLANMENMERQKAYLRVKNQLDRYKRPVDWAKAVGDELSEEAIPVFRELSVRDAKLDSGKRGTVNIRITEKPRTKKELDAENVKNDKEMSQTIDISPELIREIDFHVEIVANSAIKRSKQVEIAEARANLTDAAALPQVLSVPYYAKKYVKAQGDKEDEALVSADQGMPVPGAPAPTQKPPKVGEAPIPTDSVEAILNQSL